MKKIAIFNVGGALSCYIEIDDKKSLIDLGASPDFSPVDDFLLPLAKRGKFTTGSLIYNSGKFLIDQLFLSHLDKDHISDYGKFRETFHPDYMTCPNDNKNQDEMFKVNRDLLGAESETRTLVLDDMMGRGTTDERRPNLKPTNPLISLTEEISIHYLIPRYCEKNEILNKAYANNISLVLFIRCLDKTILFTGDLLKEGMKCLIENDKTLRDNLETYGIDYLIAPHHGLETSFSELLFQTIRGNKTKLNIISEKVRSSDSVENRSNVDSRYYDSNYSTGNNSLGQYGVKTSLGHIVIDLEASVNLIKRINDNNILINEFR